MILPDTSAWVEFLRSTGHPAAGALRAISGRHDLVVTEPVIMEILAGARSERHAAQLAAALDEYPLVPAGGRASYVVAAAIYRTCRRQGSTVRNLVDCLVAAVAIRVGASILHNNRDFDLIARYTELRIHPVEL